MYFKYAPRVQKINKEYYIEVLKWLLNAVGRKQPHFCAPLFDKAQSHTASPASAQVLCLSALPKVKNVPQRAMVWRYSFGVNECDERLYQEISSKSGNTDRSVVFIQLGSTLKKATCHTTKNSSSTAIWTKVGYFWVRLCMTDQLTKIWYQKIVCNGPRCPVQASK